MLDSTGAQYDTQCRCMATTEEHIWQALQDVKDPEIPKVSIVELGMISHVQLSEGKASITLTPTFAGCPAIHVLKEAIAERVNQVPEVETTTVKVSFEVPWNSNRITERGRVLLKESGFAPPPVHDGYIELEVISNPACPFCGSHKTEMQTPFGPTLCRSIHYCHNCLQAFEQFKPVA